MDIFSAQPTSVQSERLFSKAGIFLGKDRGKMLKENLRRSFCVSSNANCPVICGQKPYDFSLPHSQLYKETVAYILQQSRWKLKSWRVNLNKKSSLHQ